MNDLINIGFLKNTHGIKGNLVLTLNKQDFNPAPECKVIFLEMNGINSPFFVEEWFFGQKLMVKLEGINFKEQTQDLIGKSVSIKREDLSNFSNHESFDACLGYEIRDENNNLIGNITEVQTQGLQQVFVLSYQNKEILLPATQDLIILLDKEIKLIKYRIPEGLLDLYLE